MGPITTIIQVPSGAIADSNPYVSPNTKANMGNPTIINRMKDPNVTIDVQQSRVLQSQSHIFCEVNILIYYSFSLSIL